MKKIPMKFALVFIIALAFCSEDKKYSLIPKIEDLPEVGAKRKQHFVEELYFDLPGKGRYQAISKFDNISEYMGEKDGFHILKLTRTNMDINQTIGNIENPPHDYLAMEDVPCLLYINSDGWDDHVKPVDPDYEWLQPVFEAAYIDDRGVSNFFYPFGRDAVNLSIGDSWYANEDSIRMYLNSDSPESWASRSTTYTLKKVKEKKGIEIAVVDIHSDMTMELNLILYVFGERFFLTGNTIGSFDLIITASQYGQLIKSIEYGQLSGVMEMDGDKFRTNFIIRNSRRQVDF